MQLFATVLISTGEIESLLDQTAIISTMQDAP